MSSYPGPVILGFCTSTGCRPAKLQNQLTLTSTGEGALNYYGFDTSSQNASLGGRGSKSTTRESQFAIEIRPQAVVITFESGTQYTALYETHMN